MFKVVIVDDEIYVVALIQKLIDWEKFHMKVEATANDGVTALELVKEIKPDLVIVDVRMPGYDGISFMDKVREFNTKVKFIVISGHKQFDYARGAMRSHVEDYLLKPINKKELETVIGHVCEKLMESREKESMLKEMAEELDTSKKRLRESLVSAVVRGEDKELGGSLEEINQRFLTVFDSGVFQTLAFILDAPMAIGSGQDNHMLLWEMENHLKNVLQEFCMDVLELKHENLVFFFLNYRRGQEKQLRDILGEHMAKCSSQAGKFENLHFCICVGEPCKSLEELDVTVRSMWKCIFGRAAVDGGKVIEAADIREGEDILPAILEQRSEKFGRALSELNMDELTHCVKEMYSKAFYGCEEDSLLYVKLFRELTGKIYKYFSNIGICEETKSDFEARMLDQYLKASASTEYARILCSEIRRLVEENQLSERNQATPTIRIVKRYISEHYREDISLGSAAKLANISPVYLSRLFKKEEGINFLDYLNQYRIDAAKRLLQEVKYNVIEVADLSGFHNTKYFSKIFKKLVGITPSEYRKRHLGKEQP